MLPLAQKMEMETHKIIQKRIRINLERLNERRSRIYLASEAISYGWGGITLISQLSGISHKTIQLGIKELNKEIEVAPADKIRRAGAGRKREKDKQEGLEEAILEIVEGHTVGDPIRVIIWTGKSAIHIQKELRERGFKVSHELIRQILKQNEYSTIKQADTRRRQSS